MREDDEIKEAASRRQDSAGSYQLNRPQRWWLSPRTNLVLKAAGASGGLPGTSRLVSRGRGRNYNLRFFFPL